MPGIPQYAGDQFGSNARMGAMQLGSMAQPFGSALGAAGIPAKIQAFKPFGRAAAGTPGSVIPPGPFHPSPSAPGPMPGPTPGVITCPWIGGKTLTIPGGRTCPAIPSVLTPAPAPGPHPAVPVIFAPCAGGMATLCVDRLQPAPPMLANPAAPVTKYCDFAASFVCNADQYAAYGAAAAVVPPPDDQLGGYNAAYTAPAAFGNNSVGQFLPSAQSPMFRQATTAANQFLSASTF